jgi:microcystin-dependent protein
MPDKTITGIVTWLRNWFYDESEVDNLLNSKQNTLVSGTNIKTINNQSLLGQGNISIQGGGSDVVDLIYPVGSIYMSVNNVNPATLFGGEWEQIKDKFLLSSGDVYTNGVTGGSADAVVVSHTHSQTNHTHGMAHTHSHNHKAISYATNGGSGSNRRTPNGYGASGQDGVFNTDTDATASSKTTTDGAAANIQSAGESGVGKNLPPYLTVNVWKRTA